MENVSTKIVQCTGKKDQRKDGTFPIKIRVTINRKSKYLKTGYFATIENWNDSTKEIKESKKLPQSERNLIQDQNLNISESHTLVKNIIADIRRRKKAVTFPVLREIYERGGNENFVRYAINKAKLDMQNRKISEYTYELHLQKLNQLNEYHKDLQFYEIDVAFLEKHRGYMLADKSKMKKKDLKYMVTPNGKNKLVYETLKINSVFGHHSVLKKYLRKAHIEGIIDYNPFDKDFNIDRQEGARPHLTENELDLVFDYWKSGEFYKLRNIQGRYVGQKYQEVIHQFLIGCFTGLRVSDIETLKPEHIRLNENQIVKEMVKGEIDKKKPVKIPIIPETLKLLDIHNPEGKMYEGHIRSSGDLNMYLREALAIIGVCENKKIVFHSSRHTFCVTMLANKMPIKTCSEIMGHGSVTTTEVYAKIGDQTAQQDMNDAWEMYRQKKEFRKQQRELKEGQPQQKTEVTTLKKVA